MVELSMRYPFVPGLYRLVALVLKIGGTDLVATSRAKYQFYISSIIARLPQFSDDLAVSAVQVSFRLILYPYYYCYQLGLIIQ